MATVSITIGDMQTADALQLALEGFWENARDDSEHEHVATIEAAIALIEAGRTKGDFPFSLPIAGEVGEELLTACEQIEDDPETYEIEGLPALAYVESD